MDRENFLDKKRAKNNKDPNRNVVSHGKLEKGKSQMRGGEKRVGKLTGTSLQFVWKHLENETIGKNKQHEIPKQFIKPITEV